MAALKSIPSFIQQTIFNTKTLISRKDRQEKKTRQEKLPTANLKQGQGAMQFTKTQ
jgi:hypothetical protein